MILDPQALAASAAEVVEIAVAHRNEADGMIVSAFGDPGLADIRARIATPAVGIAEAAMIEAAAANRSFGIATTTPDLVAEIDRKVGALGLAGCYVGIRVTDEDPAALVADPDELLAALARMVESCVRDGAEAVIIGGGPLGQAALRLQPMFAIPIIAPIQAAVRRLIETMGDGNRQVVLASIESEDKTRCVDLFQRADETYGFEEFRMDVEDGGRWTKVRNFSAAVFPSRDTAWAAALRRVPWLAD
jgi:Asp/Glu/hydantoin racemase